MPRIICPHCAENHDLTDFRCSTTGFAVPKRYIKDFRRIPPLWLMTVGWEEVGKTTYLTMLVLTLQRLADLFEGAWFKTLGSETLRAINDMRRQIEEDHKAPSPTAVDAKLSPLLLQIAGFPGSSSRCLVLHDAPGQKFRDFHSANSLPALKRVRTIWFLVSVPDIEKRSHEGRLADLFNIYLEALENHGVEPTEVKLVVVYTKADSIDLPHEIKTYLDDDPIGGAFHGIEATRRNRVQEELTSGAYLEEMREISQALETFTNEQVIGGAGFVSIVRATGMQLEFCLTSSLGGETQGSRQLLADANPHRIIDPLLWALALDQPERFLDVALIFDSRLNAKHPSCTSRIQELWKVLTGIAEVTTYTLGRSTPYTDCDEMLLEKNLAGFEQPALLGPLLEEMPTSRIAVLFAQDIPTDSEVLRDISWQHRLLIVWCDDSPSRGYQTEFVYRPGGDSQAVVERLRNLAS